MVKPENEAYLCGCLYNTFIEMDDHYIYREIGEDGIEVPNNLELRDKIMCGGYNGGYNDDYEILVLFNNEQIEYNEETYYKIYRQLYGEDIYADFIPLEEYGIYAYTTGITRLLNDKNYILMLNRAFIKESTCPFSLNDIAHYVKYCDEDNNIFVNIPKILFEDSFL